MNEENADDNVVQSVSSGQPRTNDQSETNNAFIIMEDVVDKLKLLNYETQFCAKL